MKKILTSVFAVVALAACGDYYNYYRGDVKYVQDGSNCIYYASESGRKFSSNVSDIDAGKKIVYRNTKCADLMAADKFNVASRTERMVLNPVVVSDDAPVVSEPACGCNACGGAKLKRKYVVYPAI